MSARTRGRALRGRLDFKIYFYELEVDSFVCSVSGEAVTDNFVRPSAGPSNCGVNFRAPEIGRRF